MHFCDDCDDLDEVLDPTERLYAAAVVSTFVLLDGIRISIEAVIGYHYLESEEIA